MYPSTDHATYGIFVKRFVDLIEARDIKFDLVVIRGKGKNILSKSKKYLKFILEIYNYLIFRNYRYVYIHYLSHTSLILLPIASIKQINFVSNFHGGDLAPDTKIEQKLLPYALKLAQRSKLIVVPSTYFKKLLRSKTNIREEKILVSPSSGIDPSLFKPEVTKLDKNDREFHIGYVSRIDTNKGWDDLLQAAKRVKEQLGIKIKLHLVGKGAEMNMLKDSISTLDLDGDVIIYGEITHNELPGIYINLMYLYSLQEEWVKVWA